jgi:hypothetical protein
MQNNPDIWSMKHFYITFLLLVGFQNNIFSQNTYEWTAEDNGYLFHMVKKSPILNANLGKYFFYNGPIVKYITGEVDYDSIENIIINQPDKLIIYKDEIAKSPKGLLAEASNKMALWKLNRILLARREKKFNTARDEKDFFRFQKLLIENLPESLVTIENNQAIYTPRLEAALNPSLTFNDKTLMIAALDISVEAQLMTINAINAAINNFVEQESKAIFEALGGVCTSYTNVLVAAGDGSDTSGMLEEREKDERGRYNKGLPKAVGLFPYSPKIVTSADRKTVKIEPNFYTVSDFKTSGENKTTNIHLDVWGYNSKEQTTVVIEKKGKSYHLFGSATTRFLSPDSLFQKGDTYKKMMNILEKKMIAELTEKIYGKKGFDSEIEYHKKMRDETKVELEKQDMAYSNHVGSRKIYTKEKGAGGRKKRRFGKAKTVTDSSKGRRSKKQELLIQTQAKYDFHLRRIVEVEKEKADAMRLKGYYETELAKYNLLLGTNWVKYEVENGFYMYADSATFDITTQEFTFPPRMEQEDFEIRLLSIPDTPLSKIADEVMMHINVVDAKQNYRSKINIESEDMFASEVFLSNQKILNIAKDSIGLKEFFKSLLTKDANFQIIARGQGVGKWKGSKTVKEYNVQELQSYPKNPNTNESTREDSTFKRLRKTEIYLSMERGSFIEINSFTDPVKSKLNYNSPDLKALALKYNLSNNDILSALRTAQLSQNLKKELNVLAGTLLSREEAKKVIDIVNKEFGKARLTIGTHSVKLSDIWTSEKFL